MHDDWYEYERVPGGKLFIVFDCVDYEVRVYWRKTELLSFSLVEEPTAPLELRPRRKYVLRYNNNDGGRGTLRFRIYHESADGDTSDILAVRQEAIRGAKVVEIPFLLYPA
jgi:hypothetical protein